MDKKRNFFGGYRHANKSMPKLTGHTRQKSIKEADDDDDDDETIQKTQIETALEKANAAVLLDSANDFRGAVRAYEEAVALLQDVLATDPLRNDRLRLQKIMVLVVVSSLCVREKLMHCIISKGKNVIQ
ncbi:hypothetical protein BDB00DRAFT_127578 [Zychaea mexicana]|uniref:uncharacterized protein n=1 Tax=Zychaea mexicana TaxID=64656 RepID=UPI0022FEA168|nr:uncharacterized protein BDB00DRAFT_127578 [Zychaea mexicana]KAI9484575.1 hypothetical protein BDB00DRAFT_127578 [Zychaea mexicana]